MSILANKNSRVLVQGITGTQASFHVKRSINYGTNIVAGTSPKFNGSEHLGVPVFHNVADVKKNMDIDASVMFVPATALKNAVKEVVEAEIPLAISIANGVPMHDMLEIKAMLNGSKTDLIGPDTPGIITSEEARLGIFPENIHHKGCVGIVSRASPLTYEAVIETNIANLGQSTVVGIGDDMIVGTDYRRIIQLFQEDEQTKVLVLIGKSDSLYEQIAAEYYSDLQNKKPIIAFVAGEALPFEHNIGYAGDIITRGRVTVQDKKRLMRESGMIVVDNIAQIHQALTDLDL